MSETTGINTKDGKRENMAFCCHLDPKNQLQKPSPEEVCRYLGKYPYRSYRKNPSWAELIEDEDKHSIGEIRESKDLDALPNRIACRAVFLEDAIGPVIRWAQEDARCGLSNYTHEYIERGDGADNIRSGYIYWCSKCSVLVATS